VTVHLRADLAARPRTRALPRNPEGTYISFSDICFDSSLICRSSGVGPHRTRGRGRGGAPGATREKSAAKKPLTAEDLDKQLEQYGAQTQDVDAVDGSPAVQAAAVAAPAASGDVDVEMAV
jgi:hypothetical protein